LKPHRQQAASATATTFSAAKPKKRTGLNIEFDGRVKQEGVLEMMPDGYSFLSALSDYNYLLLMMYMAHRK